MSNADIEEANVQIKRHFPNLTVFSFKPGTKYKVMEAEDKVV